MGLGGLGNPIVLVLLALPLILIIVGIFRRPRGGAHRSVGPIRALSLLILNLNNFKGRSSRGAYWWASILWATLIVTALAGIISGVSLVVPEAGVLLTGVSFIGFYLTLAVYVRRLHDVGMSGWHYLWNFTIIGGMVLVLFLATAGKGEENKYGPDIEAGTSSDG